MKEKKIVKNSFFYVTASLFPTVINLLLLPLYTAYLSTSEFGVFALVQMSFLLLPGVMTLQVPSSITRFYFIFKNETLKQYITTLVVVVLLIASAIFIILFNVFDFILLKVFPQTPVKYYPLFYVALVIAFIKAVTNIFIALLKVREKAKYFMTGNLLALLVQIVVTLYLLIYKKLGIWSILYGQLVSSLLLFILYLIPNLFFFSLRIHFSLLHEPIKYSVPILPHAIAGLIFLYSDRIILEKYVSLSVIGLYFLSNRVASVVKLFVNEFNTAYVPTFIKASKNKQIARQNSYDLSIKVISFVCFGIALLSIIIPEIVYLFFNESYFSVWKMIPLLSTAYVFRCLYTFVSTGLFYKKKTWIIFAVSFSAAILNIVINLWLIPEYGVYVAIYSTILSFALTHVLVVFFSRNIYHIRLNYRKIFLYIGIMYLVILVSYKINISIIQAGILTLNGLYVVKFILLCSVLVVAVKTKSYEILTLLFKRGNFEKSTNNS